MTDTPAPRQTIAPTADEFKTLAMTNVQQLMNFLSSIPPHVESGAAGITQVQLDLIDRQMNRCRTWLRSWSLTKIDVPPQSVQARPDETAKASETNGATRKGGWPKGKKRNPRVPAEEGAQ